MNPEAASGQCHTDMEFVVEASALSSEMREAMDHAEDALIAAIDAIEKASAMENVDPEL